MSEGIVGLDADGVFQYRYSFFVMMQLFEYGSEVMPGGDEAGFGLCDALKNNPGIFKAFRHNGDSRQQQRSIDVIRIFTNEGLGELF